jgi:flavin-dependent amine oxidoreductase
MRAIVIGGGLAGMTCALELRRYGVGVTLLESGRRLGGKAGADLIGGRYQEHGYHVFPGWYVNTRALLAELGVGLSDVEGYYFLEAGAFPRTARLVFEAPLRKNELIGVADRLLAMYAMAQMVAHPGRRARYLDRLSIVGFLRSRWYATEAMARFNEENLLKAVAVPSYELSAFTTRTVALNWFSNPRPFLSLLNGDLQTTWIEPFAARLRALGVDVQLDRTVTRIGMEAGRVARVEAVDGAGHGYRYGGDQYVLATNLEATRALIGDEVYRADPRLGRIHQLRSAPMAGLNLALGRTLPGIPRDHVFLVGGRYALSFIDVSQRWSGLPHTTLCFIASDFRPLVGLSPGAQMAALLAEIRRYLPIGDGDIASRCLQSNLGSPLFMNTVASWPNRPEVRTKIPNLRLAGDYVRNHIDLATMEGAVSTAMAAASSILGDAGIWHRSMPRKPRQLPRLLFRALEIAAAPAIPPLYAWARLRARA